MTDRTGKRHRLWSAYRFNPQIQWSVEDGGVYIFHPASGAKWRLKYPEAALWDFLTRQLPGPLIVKMMKIIAVMEEDHTKVWIREKIEDWKRMGWLMEGEMRGKHPGDTKM
jgi:hypothetical protein